MRIMMGALTHVILEGLIAIEPVNQIVYSTKIAHVDSNAIWKIDAKRSVHASISKKIEDRLKNAIVYFHTDFFQDFIKTKTKMKN